MTEMLKFGQPLGEIMQVAYTVEDLEQAMQHWVRDLGIGPFFKFEHFPLLDAQYRGQPTQFDVNIGLAYSGGMCFELIQQNNDAPSVYRDVIDERGFGFHHWALSTRDFDGDVARYQESGAELALYGVAAVGARAGYMDTRSTLGGMIELIEIKSEVEELFAFIRAASENWNGEDPVREFPS